MRNEPWSPVVPNQPSLRRTALWIAAIALAYFIIARVGIFLRFYPPGIPAIWPPSGIFLSAVLLTRRRARPFLIGALFLADLAAEKMAGAPLALALANAAALSLSAVLSVRLLTRFFGEALSFRTIREVAGFLLLSVLLVNALTSVIAASAAALCLGVPFGSSWFWWWSSNGVGNFLFTLLIMSWSGATKAVLEELKTRAVEYGALVFLMTILSNYAFSHFTGAHWIIPLLYLFTFCFFLWASMRFGMPGAATTSLILAGLILWNTMRGHMLFFGAESIPGTVLLIQITLSMVSIPSMILAALLTERKQAVDELKIRLDVEKLEAEIFADFLGLPTSQTGSGIDSALNKLAQHAGAKCGSLYLLSDDRTTMTITHEWCEDPSDARIGQFQAVPVRQFDGLDRLLLNDKVTAISRPEDFLPETAAERERIAKNGFRAQLFIPLFREDRLCGTAAMYGPTGRSVGWSAPFIDLLQFAGNLILNLLERQRVEEARRLSEEKFSQAFHTTPDSININRMKDGLYIEVNAGFTQLTGYTPEEVRGKTSHEIGLWADPGDRARLVKELREQGRVLNFEAQFRLKDGSVRTGLMSAAPVLVGGEPCILSITRDISERKEAEVRLKNALVEKETLLRELYHRTKNNMQTINAILDLQSDSVGDERLRTILTETQNRIRSMALVHQKLYEARDLSHVNLKDYIIDLTGLLTTSYRISPDRLTLHSEMDDVLVTIDTAIPCGLILNELISNTLKHAFPSDRPGVIRIRLDRTEGGEIRMRVADDGVGPPPGFDFRRDGRMGLQTVFLLAETQLEGRVSFESKPGVVCELQFPDDLYVARV
jgi:PAS domain S-box-containing protein